VAYVVIINNNDVNNERALSMEFVFKQRYNIVEELIFFCRGGEIPACRQAGVYTNNMYYVYVLKSLTDKTYYKGRTNNINRRIREHESGNTQSIRSKRPFKLLHVEIVNTIKKAKQMEKYFKSGYGREIIKEIDMSYSPGW